MAVEPTDRTEPLLSSCRFCGNDGTDPSFDGPYVHPNDIGNWQARCDQCGARGPIEATIALAVKGWNVS